MMQHSSLMLFTALALSTCTPERAFTYEVEGDYYEPSGCGLEVSDGWECRPDTCTESCGYMVAGPYSEPDPGLYRAYFHLVAIECSPADDKNIVRIEVNTKLGEETINLATTGVRCIDIINEYTNIYLDIELPGGELEMGVVYVGPGIVTLDHVRLEGL